METITINIVFFGVLKAFYGEKQTLEVPFGSTINDVIQVLMKIKPEAKDILESCQCAVNSDIISKDHRIMESSEFVLLPPFSGG